MSLDYPNRNDWLAVRRTPSVLNRGRVVWINGTYAPGRNKRKRTKRALDAIDRKYAVASFAAVGEKAPKHRYATPRR